MTLPTVFLIVALVLLVLAGLSVSGGRVQLGWFGLAFVVASLLIGGPL